MFKGCCRFRGVLERSYDQNSRHTTSSEIPSHLHHHARPAHSMGGNLQAAKAKLHLIPARRWHESRRDARSWPGDSSPGRREPHSSQPRRGDRDEERKSGTLFRPSRDSSPSPLRVPGDESPGYSLSPCRAAEPRSPSPAPSPAPSVTLRQPQLHRPSPTGAAQASPAQRAGNPPSENLQP